MTISIDNIDHRPGVYAWYAENEQQSPIAIYIGQSDWATITRAYSQLGRIILTSDARTCPYSTLDTDFIVGTALHYFDRKGYVCVWKHISNQPSDENRYVREQNPVLQNCTGKIKAEYKLRKAQGYWRTRKNTDGVKEAEAEIFALLNCQFAFMSQGH